MHRDDRTRKRAGGSAAAPRARTGTSWTTLSAAVVLAGALAACGRDEPVVTVGGVPIAVERYRSLAEPDREALADLAAIGAAIARDEVDSLGAPIVERGREDRRLSEFPYTLAVRRLRIDQETMRRAYADRPEWELTVRHVVRLVPEGAPPVARDSARRVATDVARRARDGQDFASLAASFSEEPGAAERGGRLQPGRKGSWVEPFWNAAISLPIGQPSGVVESPYGYHVILVDDRRPVPYEEADRSALLRWVVPRFSAEEAMEAWVAEEGAVEVRRDEALAARSILTTLGVPPEEQVLATGTAGITYGASDLAAGWARLGLEERLALERGSEEVFLGWVEADARRVVYADRARDLGTPLPAGSEDAARREWYERIGRWAGALGFRPGMSDADVAGAAIDAALTAAPAARSAKAEIRSLRPLLRRSYPVVTPD
jgi:hypothetical protein